MSKDGHWRSFAKVPHLLQYVNNGKLLCPDQGQWQGHSGKLHTIATLKQVLQAGIKMHRMNGGATLDNPAVELKRSRVKQKHLQLAESPRFKTLVGSLRNNQGLITPFSVVSIVR